LAIDQLVGDRRTMRTFLGPPLQAGADVQPALIAHELAVLIDAKVFELDPASGHAAASVWG
jgi:hypothetical protein